MSYCLTDCGWGQCGLQHDEVLVLVQVRRLHVAQNRTQSVRRFGDVRSPLALGVAKRGERGEVQKRDAAGLQARAQHDTERRGVAVCREERAEPCEPLDAELVGIGVVVT